MLKTLAKEIKICSLTKDKSCSLPIIFSIDVTPKSLIPHGIISLKNLKSVFTFNAKPCIVTHFVILTPWAPIFSSLTQTPVKPSFLVALILNNFDWNNELNIIEFFRDFGKALTVNYMMSKDSVKKRLGSDSSDGMSFTEFTYQLFQAYDFYYLLEN